MKIEAEADIRRKEAAEWFTLLNQRKVTTADVRRFSDWRRDPENALAFSRMEAMWDAAGALAENPEMAKLTQDARNRLAGPSKERRTSGRLVPLGVAGAIAVIAGAGAWIWFDQRPLAYATTIGEQRTIRLEDGSRIVLDTNSRVSVRYSQNRRTVTLASGQAMFDVEGDTARPFIVKAGDTEVTALGTRFDVRLSGAGARVILVEGHVAIRRNEAGRPDWTLTPGQQVTTSVARPQVTTVNVMAATSWAQGRLMFENTPIAAAVAEVNRYTREPIELRDQRISSIRVSGAFNAGDIDGFVAALTDLYALKATRSAEGRIILTAPT